jgi:hypothetical protein
MINTIYIYVLSISILGSPFWEYIEIELIEAIALVPLSLSDPPHFQTNLTTILPHCIYKYSARMVRPNYDYSKMTIVKNDYGKTDYRQK